ncbi:DNA polymerase alpha 2 [Actinidia rufa]|uniref:DNA polymerase alpha subunit B n=1 Tax=Actinidia rufa TaxID=165716 RepID=A0A7J0EPP2_9ERIC|nr:DNA polymerase alpha 2 [Actinidia rufa]
MEEEIKEEFKKNGFTLDDEEEILNKCLTFCIQYKLSPSDLVSRWEAYSLNRQLELTVQNSHMDAFLLHLQDEQKEAIIKKESGLHMYSNDFSMILSDGHEDTKEGFHGTPTYKSHALHPEPVDSIHKPNGDIFSAGKPSQSVTPFGQRKNKFVVQSTLNDLSNIENIKKEHDHENSEDFIIKRVQPSARCSLVIQGSKLEPGCRFMYDKIEDKFNFLENRIRKHSTALVASGLCEEVMDPAVASPFSNFLTVLSILAGKRVRLDLQKLSQFSIFPGQIVGVEGHNPSGHCLIASKLIDYIPISVSSDEHQYPTKKQAVDKEFQLTDPSHMLAELSMIVAAGPFTTTDNLFFEPLAELLAYARRKQPQLLLLLGPFIDTEHPEIKKGTINKTFDEIFRLEILGRLQDYVEYMGSATRVILVPSIRDANHDFVFPQPPFDIHQTELKHQITSLTNPGIFSANETNTQPYLLLSETFGNSFYPLYPPMEGTPLDFSLAPEALQISRVPDILILSSDLAHFMKVLSLGDQNDGQEQVKCVCVNPGRLARGEGAGFFRGA